MMTCNDQEIHEVMMTNRAQKSQRFIRETFLEGAWKSVVTFEGQDDYRSIQTLLHLPLSPGRTERKCILLLVVSTCMLLHARISVVSMHCSMQQIAGLLNGIRLSGW